MLVVNYDRYGGAELEVPPPACGASAGRFDAELASAIEAARGTHKKGLWLKLPIAAAPLVAAAPRLVHGGAARLVHGLTV